MFKFLKEKLGNWTKKISEDESVVDESSENAVISNGEEISVDLNRGKSLEKAKKITPKANLSTSLDNRLKGKAVADEIKGAVGSEEKESPGTKSFFKRVTSKIQKIKISDEEFEVYGEELKMLLLENNVAFEVADKIVEQLKEEVVGREFLRKEAEFEIKEVIKKIISDVLIEPPSILDMIEENKKSKPGDPFVFLFVGSNGAGKTTTVAKIASFLSGKGISCVLAAADTFRAASIEQLKHHGDKVGVKVISHQYGSDPASVGFDAIQYAKKNGIDCVLIDTAGRMHTSKNLLKEVEKISKVCKPNLKIFVGESITGNDSVEQVKSFNWSVSLDGIVLTKADIDERGGTALSLGYVTKKPILFLGTGQEYDKIEVFDKGKFLRELGL